MQWRSRHRSWKRGLTLIAIPLLAFFFIQSNVTSPVIRFSGAAANHIAFVVGCAMPLFAVLFSFALPKWWATLLAQLLIAPLLLFGLLMGMFASMDIPDILRSGRDAQFDNLAKIPMSSGQVGIYRNNGSATENYGIVVEQECSILPGVLIVRRLGGFYPAHDASYIILGPDALKVEAKPYDQEGDRSQTYQLKRFVYF